MASFISFFSLRQTDRTVLTLGSCVFLLKQPFPPQFMVANVLATTSGQSKLKNASRQRPDSEKRMCPRVWV